MMCAHRSAMDHWAYRPVRRAPLIWHYGISRQALRAACLPPLGGPAREKIRAYCTGDDLDWAQELGFNAFKITNPAHYEEGIAGINTVEDKVAAAREAVGRNSELMINPVMAYDVEFAVRLCVSGSAPTSCGGLRNLLYQRTLRATFSCAKPCLGCPLLPVKTITRGFPFASW